jgi:hypothetical protein
MSSTSRRRFVISAACFLAARRLPAQEPAQGKEEGAPSFSSDVQVVNLLATVRDKKGQFVSDLGKTDFTLLEDGPTCL